MPNKLTSFAKMITVEPAYFVYWSVYIIVDTTTTNLMLQKTCRFSKISEPDLNTPCDDEKLGILFANEMNSSYRFIMFIFCVCCSVFATSWSDSAGRRRRPLFIMPIIGLIIQAMLGCLHTYFWSWLPTAAMSSHAVAEMMSGGIIMINLTSQMYICDVSPANSRTMRVGVLIAVRTFGDFAGYGSSGFILRSLGFFYTYLVCFALSIISLILALVFVKDISIPVEEKAGLGKIFSLVEIVNGFKIVFKKTLGKKRKIVLILLVIYCLTSFINYGEKTVLYLFLRYKFHKDEREFSMFVLYRYIGATFGGIFCSLVLSKLLHVHDGLIGAFVGIFDAIGALGYVFVNQNWQLYIVPLFEIFQGTTTSVSLSFITKFYDSSELGRLNSVLGLFSIMVPTCYPVYNGIFAATLVTFPSAAFLINVSSDAIIVTLYCIVYLLSRRIQEEPIPVVIEVDRMLID